MLSCVALLLGLELLSFGAVSPHFWLGVNLLWTVFCTILVVQKLFRGKAIDFRFLFFLIVIFIIGSMAGPKFATGLFAAGWVWYGSKEGKTIRILGFLHALLVIGILEAVLGLGQYFVAPGWIFGYQNQFSVVSGTLINRNHYAGLMEMFTLVAFGLAFIGAGEGEVMGSYLYLLAGAVMALALCFSMSRMGLFSFFMTALILTVLIGLQGGQARLGALLGLGIIGLVLAGALWIGIDSIVAHYAQALGPNDTIQEGRLPIFRDEIGMIRQNPWGVGAGRFQDFFRRYQTTANDRLYDHAHNDYFETTAEWGIPVAAGFWAIVFLILFRAIRAFIHVPSHRQRGILLGCIGGIIAILIHSLADFNLQIPSNALLFFSLLGIAGALGSNIPRLERSGIDYVDYADF